MLRFNRLLVILVLLVGCSARVSDREDFKKSLWGLSSAEVRNRLGNPDRISADPASPGRAGWIYQNRTRNPGTGATDSEVRVQFFDDKATDFTFTP